MRRALLLLILVLVPVLGASLYYRQSKTAASSDATFTVLNPFIKTRSIFSYFLLDKPKPQKIIFGYLPYWSIDKLKYIQTDKLTDVAYFGLHINPDGSFMTTLEDGSPELGYTNWKENKDLADFIVFANKQKIRVSLTVISHTDEISDKFLTCKDCWPTLLANIKAELNLHKIKDINLNFEYVEFPKEEMTAAYTELTNYLNQELDKEYGSSFLTVATFADSFVKPRVSDVEALGKVADGLFIMAYDFHQPNSSNAGPVSPVDGKGVHAEYDINTMVNDYLRVVPPSKLIMGIPYYGYNWVVETEEEYSKRIPGNDNIGFSQSQAYSDIMDTIIELDPEILWDELGKVPYFTYTSPETNSTRQVYFENAESIKVKYDLVKKHNLAGVGIWALGYDGGYQELWDLLAMEFFR